MTALFLLGSLVATPGAVETMDVHGISPITLINRHVSGDWSESPAEDRKSNHEAIKYGSRVFSSYVIAHDVKIWIITEADRSSTTILLPEEY